MKITQTHTSILLNKIYRSILLLSITTVFLVGGFLLLGNTPIASADTTPTWTVDANSNVTDCAAATTDASAITTCKTIQSAIDAASSDDIIDVKAGNYAETLNLQGKTLTIEGAGVDTTTINATSSTGYAIQNFGDSSTVSNLTLKGTTNNYGFKISHISDITLENINVVDSYKTGIDLNTVNGATLSNVNISGTDYGFGLMILNSNDVTITNVTTTNNAWGGVSIQTSASTGSSNNITFSGTFNASEDSPLLLENDRDSNDSYHDITDVTLPSKFGFVVYGFRPEDNYKQWFYQETLTNAKSFAQSLISGGSNDVVVYNVAGDNYYVFDGMKIQSAITAASSGDTIDVAPGNYNENVTISKSLTLEGANVGIDPNSTSTTRTAESVISPNGGTAITVSSDGVTIDGFKITNGEKTGTGIYSSDNSNLVIKNNIVTNIGSTSTIGKGIIIVSASKKVSDVLITKNDITNLTSSGISIGWHSGNKNIIGLIINNNTISDVNANRGAYGILIDHGLPKDGSGQTVGAKITNNHISYLAGSWAHAIGLEGDTPEAFVSGNTISNVSVGSGVDAVAVHIEDNPSAGSVKINNNSFSDVSIGVNSVGKSEGEADATNNYWGSTNPDFDKIVSGDVNYSPWFTNSDMTILSDHTVVPKNNGDVSIDETNPEVIITSSITPINLTINSNTNNPKIDLHSLISSGTGTIPKINITSSVGGININVLIPKTKITGDSGWDGVLAGPTAKVETVSVPDGYSSTNVTSAIEIGSSKYNLTFDKAVKLTFTGQAGKRIGWYNVAGTFTEITNTCDNLTSPILVAGGSCKIDATNDTDLIVWTKHFSTFVTYTQTPIITTAGGGTFTPPAPVASTPVVAPVVSPVVVAAPISTTPTAPAGQVLGAETYNFSLRLASGSKGDEVKQLQTFIKNLDFNCGPKDGIFGPKTKAGVIYLQLTNHLVGDGIVGPLTRAVLNK